MIANLCESHPYKLNEQLQVSVDRCNDLEEENRQLKKEVEQKDEKNLELEQKYLALRTEKNQVKNVVRKSALF